MKKRPLSNIEIIGIVFLLAAAIGAAWYFYFYTPLQNEITNINTQSSQVDQNIQIALTKLKKMNEMQEEIDAIFAESDDPSEIAVFDNYQNVFTQLDAILSTTQDYSLGFSDPQEDQSTGIVRRYVTLSFKVNSYDEAKNILMALEQNHWRCLLNSVSLSTSGSSETGVISDQELTVSASLVFFESTKIEAE